MKCIVGLGNPGKKYERTRHNAGFMVLDLLAKQWQLHFEQQGISAVAMTERAQERILLVKPLTFMNGSGESVVECMKYYGILAQDMCIIHDDLDLPVGRIRLRFQGSSGGQKGMQDILDRLQTRQLKRIRIGIGKDPAIATIDYVLARVPAEQEELFFASLSRAAAAVNEWITEPFVVVMNRYNGG